MQRVTQAVKDGYNRITGNVAVQQTRFEARSELAEVTRIIKKIENEKDYLYNIGNDLGAQSVAYKKYNILDQIMKVINKARDPYNNKLQTNIVSDSENDEEDSPESLQLRKDLKESEELTEICNFVESVLQDIIDLRDVHQKTLSIPRNHDKENFSTAIRYASYVGGAIAGLATLPFSFVFSAGIGVFAGNKANQKLQKVTGANDKQTESLKLVNELIDSLSSLQKNLDDRINGLVGHGYISTKQSLSPK